MPDRTHRRELFPVALRKESVDRNRLVAGSLTTLGGSLSARRAWIEIVWRAEPPTAGPVALRKESVDRNVQNYDTGVWAGKSLSARRAWIEMSLLKASKTGASGRSPQGERG